MDVQEPVEGGGDLGGAGGGDHQVPHLTRVYTNPDMDRSEWGPGPWDEEPDKISWTDEETGLPCLLVRNQMSAWCGYVAVEPGHPLHGKDYEVASDLHVHGGLTFSSFCQEDGDENHSICHIPEPGKPDRVYWFGFDAAHAHDLVPSYTRFWQQLGYNSDRHFSYRTAAYMRTECERLARQLKDIELVS